MRNLHFTISVLAALAATTFAPKADAQVYAQTVYYGAPAVTYVQPATVYRPVLRPFTRVVTPAVAPVYVAPQPVVVARPTIPVVPVAPVAPVVTTRYRPILGGTVTRSWYP